MSSTSVLYFLLQLCLFSTLISKSYAAFGAAFDYGRDETFEKMGDAKIAEFTVTNDDGFCVDNWKKFGSTCYYLAHNAQVDYDTAVTECAELNAQLATVDSQDIQDFLTALLFTDSNYIIGLNDIDTEGNFTWQNGDAPTFTAWNGDAGEPDNIEIEDCVGMQGNAQGRWYDYVCTLLRAFICQRSSVPGHVHLHIVFEDTYEVDEMWLFDFQPFEFDTGSGIVSPIDNMDTNPGTLKDGLSGSCSNVFTTTAYDPATGYYKDSFLPIPPGNKDLYQALVRGDTLEVKDDFQVRTDFLTFDGDMESLFGCTNSMGDSVWEQRVTNESIEFNTTLYMTNIRPKFATADGTIFPSYIQSYISLYWRLLRVAISRFLVSSVERLKPIFQYAIVSTVYRNDNEDDVIDWARAEVELSFWTVTDIQSSDSLISVYKPVSFTYTPVNSNNGLSHVKEVPDGGCHDALGMEGSTNITDSQITTSSTLEDSNMYSGKYARLNEQPVEGVSAGAWFAGVDDAAPYIQITFIAMTTVSGVVTQGQMSSIGDLWVESYFVQYEVYAQSSLTYIKDDAGNTKRFPANFDRETTVTNYFPEPVRTMRIRIEPNDTSSEGLFEGYVAMRIELLGCRDEVPVRLADGSGPHEGRVEVYHDGSWGTICNNQWEVDQATVVCRQLGYRYAEFHNNTLRFFGEGTDPIFLDNVICDGREATLGSCQHDGFSVHNCSHLSDVGVLCSQDTIVSEPSVRLVDGTYHYEGRVEIWHNNEWGTICNTAWSMTDAHIVCRELGFADAIEAVTAADGRFGSAPSDFKIWLDNVNCLGGESSLSECTHNGWDTNSCAHVDDVGVVCAGETPKQSVEDLAVLHAPPCNYTFSPGGCTQHWLFTIVLDVDNTNLESGVPLDATGEFEFLYYLYECPDLNAVSGATRETCQKINVPDAVISHEVTLQTTVEVADEETDMPMLEVVKVYGSDPSRDLRYNLFQPGISHEERVTIETKFFPEFLRGTLELELTLFMVCIGDYQDVRDGCLAAPTDERYSSFTSPFFYYTKLVNQNDPEGATEDLTADSLAGDASQQELESYQYIADQDLHRSTFINKALSAESRIYTVTNVFQLVEKGTGGSRVVRREIIENAQAPLGVKNAFFFAGCPEHSTYNGKRECVCDGGLVYSTESFQCVPIYTGIDNNKLPDSFNDDGSVEEIDNVIDVNLEDRAGDNGSSEMLQRSGVVALLMTVFCIIMVSALSL